MAAEHVERIALRMRQRRDELGLTRKQLVQRMQGLVTENDIYRWEKGKHRPGDDTLQEIARALEVDVSYFFLEDLPDAEDADAPDLLGALGGADRLARIEEKLDDLLERMPLDALTVIAQHQATIIRLAEETAKQRAAGPKSPGGRQPKDGKPAAPRARAQGKRRSA